MESKLEAKMSEITRMLGIMVQQHQMLKAHSGLEGGSDTAGDTDGNISSFSTSSLGKRNRHKKKRSRRHVSPASTAGGDTPRAVSPVATAETRPSRPRKKAPTPAESGNGKARAPQGSKPVSTDSSLSPSPSPEALSSSRKKFRKSDSPVASSLKETEPQRAQSPVRTIATVTSQVHSPARAKVVSQGLTMTPLEA